MAGRALNISPCRRHGSRDAWIGQKGDPMTTVLINDPPAIGVALKNMLAIRMPTAR
jgi:hypothetical protein